MKIQWLIFSLILFAAYSAKADYASDCSKFSGGDWHLSPNEVSNLIAARCEPVIRAIEQYKLLASRVSNGKAIQSTNENILKKIRLITDDLSEIYKQIISISDNNILSIDTWKKIDDHISEKQTDFEQLAQDWDSLFVLPTRGDFQAFFELVSNPDLPKDLAQNIRDLQSSVPAYFFGSTKASRAPLDNISQSLEILRSTATKKKDRVLHAFKKDTSRIAKESMQVSIDKSHASLFWRQLSDKLNISDLVLAATANAGRGVVILGTEKLKMTRKILEHALQVAQTSKSADLKEYVKAGILEIDHTIKYLSQMDQEQISSALNKNVEQEKSKMQPSFQACKSKRSSLTGQFAGLDDDYRSLRAGQGAGSASEGLKVIFRMELERFLESVTFLNRVCLQSQPL